MKKFTLIEVLVVVAIIAILGSMIFSATMNSCSDSNGETVYAGTVISLHQQGDNYMFQISNGNTAPKNFIVKNKSVQVIVKRYLFSGTRIVVNHDSGVPQEITSVIEAEQR